MKKKLLLMGLVYFYTSQLIFAQLNVNFTVNTSAERAEISPLIYGTNFILNPSDKYKSYRMGGNRFTGLNWENNASNAGSDWYHSSDNHLCNVYSVADCNSAGKVFSAFYNQSKTLDIPYAISTVQLAGYVAADKSGVVSEAETAPSGRWKQVVFKKNAPFTLSPNTTDNYVYIDELINYLKVTHGSASSGGIKGYFLDNEAGLWSHTHSRLHPSPAGAAELWMQSRDAAIAIKDVDPTVETFGGVFYGFSGMYDLANAPDWAAQKGNYSWYIDYYLAKMKAASDANGKRLLDVLDFHWYPEAMGDTRVTSNSTSTNDRIARMQAPRSLWDPEYTENSWIGQWFRSYLPIIPRVQSSVNNYYPNTKISISEYFYGAAQDYSGGIAQADVLGIFGKFGIYNANLFNDEGGYISSAFRIYTNYNGSGSAFGNTKVSAIMSDKVNTSVYASIHGSDEENLHLIVINKSGQQMNGNFTINSGVNYEKGAAWGFDQSGTAITSRAAINSISGNKFAYSLPPYSVYHIVLSAGASNTTNTSVIVRARSINPGANIRVEVIDAATETGGTVVQSKDFLNISTAATDYTATFTGNIPANRIRVRFTNDGGSPNRDLEVDYIQVAGITYQSEAPNTYVTGIYTSTNGCNTSGYLQKQTLHCNGFFHYGLGSNAARLSAQELSSNLSEQSLVIYPNPLKGDVLRFELPSSEEGVLIKINSLVGKEYYKKQLKKDEREVSIGGIPNGLYNVMIETGGKTIVKKLAIEQ